MPQAPSPVQTGWRAPPARIAWTSSSAHAQPESGSVSPPYRKRGRSKNERTTSIPWRASTVSSWATTAASQRSHMSGPPARDQKLAPSQIVAPSCAQSLGLGLLITMEVSGANAP